MARRRVPGDHSRVSAERCDGCRFLRYEDRPHGIKAARCANPEAGSGTIRGFGRTLEIFGTGEIGPVVRPVWCGGLPQSLRDSSLKEGAYKERRVV